MNSAIEGVELPNSYCLFQLSVPKCKECFICILYVLNSNLFRFEKMFRYIKTFDQYLPLLCIQLRKSAVDSFLLLPEQPNKSVDKSTILFFK